MARLAREAGLERVEVIPTKGKPGVFATLDAGADTTLGVYLMYDVKQYDAAEWSSPPLEGRLVERPGVGTVMLGRGATNTKGPQVAFLAALHAFKAAGQAPAGEHRPRLRRRGGGRTVENHRMNIAKKLGLHGHNAVLKFALEHRMEL